MRNDFHQIYRSPAEAELVANQPHLNRHLRPYLNKINCLVDQEWLSRTCGDKQRLLKEGECNSPLQ